MNDVQVTWRRLVKSPRFTLGAVFTLALGSILLGRALQGLLFEVQATVPLTFGTVAAVVGVAALWSSYLPGRDAARTEPAVALRQE